MTAVVYKSRILLIRFAKLFPFILCSIVLLSYLESLFALVAESYYEYGTNVILYKPISWFIGGLFVYDWYTLVAATVFAFAFETCVANKLSIVYLCFNAWERDYFITIELYPEYIYAICTANIIVSGFLVYKGTNILRKRKQNHD